MNDLILLVGRPTQMVSFPFNLAPNSVWQSFSGYDFGGGFFGGGGFGGGSALFYLITDIQGPQSTLWKVNLHDIDYVAPSWGPDWENDVAENPLRWFPID